MKCVICKTGELHSGRTTVTLQGKGVTIIVKNVPADICDNCGEYYLSEEITDRILTLAEESRYKGAEIEILRWAA
ncbi:MAG: type II toxin-antitoxin system MqsA family antitoxin [Methylothermaceae bacterium]|nr:type II toxin-antitoxin system MqsA family antitoxin [Methylothermaceae bacterium]